MNITFVHDLDTGFLSATLKPALEQLGHNVCVMQTVNTFIEPSTSHVDISLAKIDSPEGMKEVQERFKETDLFFLRAWNDLPLQLLDVTKYANNKNTIFRVHGSDLREHNIPYSLKAWRIDWHGREPMLVGPRDASLIPKYRGNVITTIERPIDLSLIPKHRPVQPPFAITTPTSMDRKGTELLKDLPNRLNIPLHIVSGVSRKEALEEKSHASYYIDRLGTYNHGPYGMNSVEAWLMHIPVFSQYEPIDTVLCPELSRLIHNINIDTIQDVLHDYVEDRRQLNYAYNYARTNHDPLRIAQQYIDLYRHISQTGK